MTLPTATPGLARFGPYEVDMRSGELRKFGTRIKLGEQPLRILTLLIERPGDLVSRQELRSQLWSDNTFVDFDHGLNAAVQRLRDSLSDTAEQAKWIETVPRRGYRFVGSVAWTRPSGSTPTPEAEILEPFPGPHLVPEAPIPASRRIWRWRFFALAAALILVPIGMVRLVRGPGSSKPATAIRSIAVLPLENLTGDSSQDYFADGMTDELITALAKIHSIRVISRTSIMQYKGVHRPVRDIARDLGVEGILEGSISHAGDRVHIRVQLIHAATDTHVWAETYDRELNDAFALPEAISQMIAKEVDVAVSAPAPQRYVNRKRTTPICAGVFSGSAIMKAPACNILKRRFSSSPITPQHGVAFPITTGNARWQEQFLRRNLRRIGNPMPAKRLYSMTRWRTAQFAGRMVFFWRVGLEACRSGIITRHRGESELC